MSCRSMLSKLAEARSKSAFDEEGRTRSRESFVVSAPFAGRVRRLTLQPR